MRTLTTEEHMTLIAGAQVIEADGFGDKVLLLNNGDYLKLFRRKRLLSSALLVSPSMRFIRNAGLLVKRGVSTVTITDHYYIPSLKRMAVHYQPLLGETLRTLLADSSADNRSKLMTLLGVFIARLHKKGIYFRSLHLGNIVRTPNCELGLIDVADMRCGYFSVNIRCCLRNFRHFVRSNIDMELLNFILRKQLLDAYCEASGRSNAFRVKLWKVLY
ncbi:MAG: toluene tolerance protein [Endozoicomonadaceae bacterium]|nr:toluene tolerance protein [Endozoicomonadaceae bacterium]